jgi:hypothetical protein
LYAHASAVSLVQRIGYVKDTIAILDQVRQLSEGQAFVVNWIAAIVDSELPGFFQRRKAAQDLLSWCVEHADKAPHAGWLREVYYHLGKLALADGERAKAQDYLRRSGYKGFDMPITLITPFSEDLASGHTFSPRRIAEILPGRVYALSGFEFTDYNGLLFRGVRGSGRDVRGRFHHAVSWRTLCRGRRFPGTARCD